MAAFLVQAALDQAAIPNRTYRVSTGEEALAYLHKAGLYREAPSPGLIILDLKLPHADGWTVLEAIKNHTVLRRIPVVVLSASAAEADRDRARRMGATEYILKENSVSAMRSAIVKACSALMSFRILMDVAPGYMIRTPTIAFEQTLDNGVEINIATVLPEGATVKLMGTEIAESAAHVRYEGRNLWMSLHDLRDHTVAATHLSSPVAQCR